MTHGARTMSKLYAGFLVALRDGGAQHADLNADHGSESFGGPIL